MSHIKFPLDITLPTFKSIIFYIFKSSSSPEREQRKLQSHKLCLANTRLKKRTPFPRLGVPTLELNATLQLKDSDHLSKE